MRLRERGLEESQTILEMCESFSVVGLKLFLNDCLTIFIRLFHPAVPHPVQKSVQCGSRAGMRLEHGSVLELLLASPAGRPSGLGHPDQSEVGAV